LVIFIKKNPVKKLLLLVLFIPLFSFGQTFDFSFSDGPNFELAEFRFWKPESKVNYNGVLVLVPGLDRDGRETVLDTVWQKFATKHNFIILACHFKNYQNRRGSSAYYDASKGSGDILLKSIKKYSKVISNKDINDLPLLFYGFSAGGQFNYEFASWKPEKVISFVVNKGGYYITGLAPAAARKVPGIFFIGEYDQYYRNDMIQGIYSANRSLGANWTLIIEKNTKHSPKNSKELAISFFESIIPKRLLNKNLLELNVENPLLGFKDQKIFKYLNEIEKKDFNRWGKLDYLTIWLSDEIFANIWLQSLK
jgi:dienelactone hydrolase